MEQKPPMPAHRQHPESQPDGHELHDDPFVDHLLRACTAIREKYFTRPVTTFIDVEGEEYRAAGDQAEFEADDEEPGRLKIWLKTHEKGITVAACSLLIAAGLVALQRNRSQRKRLDTKEGKRTSSFRREPKGSRKLPG